MEEVLGEIAAEFNDITFFIAACYKSQVDLTYLCLQSQKVAFQHAPVVPQGAYVSMESAFSGAELQSTLYHTEPGVRQVDGKTGEPMFAFAIKVSGDTSKNIKVQMQMEQKKKKKWPSTNTKLYCSSHKSRAIFTRALRSCTERFSLVRIRRNKMSHRL